MKQTSEDKHVTQFLELLAGRSGERHVVVLQDFPDPDAISCGFAYRLLAGEHGIETDLVYGGRISHQENIAMVNLLDITLQVWDREKIAKDLYQGSIYVDNQGTTTHIVEHLQAAGVPVLAVVDHHEPQDRLKPIFQDIRHVGACASIFTDYLIKGAMPLVNSKPEHRRLATALMHGIVSETGSMIRAQPLDFTAAAFLQPFYDNETLVEILHQRRSSRVMEVIRLALANRVIREGFCLSGVGYIRDSDRDAIPQAADFLLTEETVHTAIVYGIVMHSHGGEAINGSLRTTKNTMNPDNFLKEVLGRMDNGSFYGGGKALAGGFEIPLGFLSGHDDDPNLARVKWEAFDVKLRNKFYHNIGVGKA